MTSNAKNTSGTSLPQESFTPQAMQYDAPAPRSDSFLSRHPDLKANAVLGAIALTGAALGAYAGHATGVIAGLLGGVVGASAGASLGMITPGEHIKLGGVVGALAGTLAGALSGNPVSTVALGLAGASLPFGGIAAFAASRS